MDANKTKKYRLICLIIGILILILPLATYSIIKNQTESSGRGIVVGENDAYQTMFTIGIIGIALGALFYYFGNENSVMYFLIILVAFLIIWTIAAPKPLLGV